MFTHKLREFLESRLPLFAVAFVALEPLVRWVFESWDKRTFASNPYGIGDIDLLLITSLLLVIYLSVTRSRETGRIGDEDKIIMNRNESDYYEIWEEVRGQRDITIDALGHSFNTLWYNFIKKFLYEFLANPNKFNSISIRLVSTVGHPYSFEDITAFIKSLDSSASKKLTIILTESDSPPSYFTGLCVNKSALWLSIREPHRTAKVNEHVREWRRASSPSAQKMIDWYLGIVDYLDSSAKKRTILGVGAAIEAEEKSPTKI